MKNKTILAHKEFVSLITSPDEIETSERIRNLREQDAPLNSLFEIIEEMKFQVQIEPEMKPEIFSFKNFDEIEDLLIRVFAGAYQSNEAQNFMDGIIFSPLFFQRVLLKLRQLALITTSEDLPEMANVQVKSNQEILERFILTDITKHEELAPSRQAGNRSESFLERLRNLIFPPNALPKYALAFATVILLGIMIPNITGNLSRQNLLDDYLISVNYESSALRAGSPQISGSAELQNFVNNFELAMGDFLTSDYAVASKSFKSLESTATRLRSSSLDKNVLSIIRNYYFYYGYSHLALAKPALIDFNEGNEKQHLQDATRLFQNAKSIGDRHNLDNLQRENYFIALAAGLSGNKESAIQMLQKIPKASEYSSDAERLIREWVN